MIQKIFTVFRSGFKASDQVQGQGAGRSRKRSPANGGMSNTFIGGLQRSHWALDGVLKPLLVSLHIKAPTKMLGYFILASCSSKNYGVALF